MTRPGSWPRWRPAGRTRTPSAGWPPGPRRRAPRSAPTRSCRPLAQGEPFTELVEPHAIHPIAKPIAADPNAAVLGEQRTQQGRNLSDRDVGCVDAVEACAVEIAAEHHVVLAERGADEADIS